MIEIGRICMKIAGRDAGKKCVILDKPEKYLVLIAGETRKRKCNILHLEPMDKVVSVSKDMGDGELAKVLKEAGIELRQTKPKEQKERPRKKRKSSSELREKKTSKKKTAKTEKTESPAKGKAGSVEQTESAPKKKAPKKKAAKKGSAD